jgi:hypothetical protein
MGGLGKTTKIPAGIIRNPTETQTEQAYFRIQARNDTAIPSCSVFGGGLEWAIFSKWRLELYRGYCVRSVLQRRTSLKLQVRIPCGFYVTFLLVALFINAEARTLAQRNQTKHILLCGSGRRVWFLLNCPACIDWQGWQGRVVIISTPHGTSFIVKEALPRELRPTLRWDRISTPRS